MIRRLTINRERYVSALTPLVLVVSVFLFNIRPVLAAEITGRTLTIGSSKISQNTTYGFTFTTVSSAVVGSIDLEFCKNSPLFNQPCNAPAGLNLNGALLTSQSGLVGFGIDPSSTVNKLILSRVPSLANPTSNSYIFNNVINPSILGSVFVRISTHASNNGTGPNIDDGAVVFVINQGLGATGFVPPFLILCVGVSVSQNCSSTTGSLITMGEFSKTSPRIASTQFSLATNDVLGFVAYISGTTLTSGNNIIPGLNAPTGSVPGTSQFGINLRANTNPGGGLNPSGPGTGVPTANYNSPNQFMFNSGDAIAASVFSTDFTKFTVTYLANINNGQAAGVYATTMTYIAVVQF